MIVSILAIEGLTGAVAAKPVVIGAAANSSGGASGADAAVRLDDQNKLVQKKAEAVGKKQAAYDEQNGTGKDCETIAKAVADKKEDGLTQALKDKRPKCEAAAGELDAAKKEKSDADAHYKALAGIAASGGIPVSAGGTLMTSVASGALDTNRPSDMATVADAVKAIVMGTFDQDEMQLTCLKAFQDDSMQGLRAQCSEYLKSRVAVETARNLATETQIKAARASIDDQTNALFERLWAQVSKDGALDSQKLEALQKSFGNEWPQCFTGAKDKAKLSECFSSLRAQQKRDLAEGKKSNGKP